METTARQKTSDTPGEARYASVGLTVRLLQILVAPLQELGGKQAQWSVAGLSKRLNCSGSTTRRLLDACRQAGLPLKEEIRRKDAKRFFYLLVQDFQAFFDGSKDGTLHGG